MYRNPAVTLTYDAKFEGSDMSDDRLTCLEASETSIPSCAAQLSKWRSLVWSSTI